MFHNCNTDTFRGVNSKDSATAALVIFLPEETVKRLLEEMLNSDGNSFNTPLSPFEDEENINPYAGWYEDTDDEDIVED